MPRPEFIPLALPTIHERRERQHELKWLFDLPAPRKPRRSREGQVRPELDEVYKDALGILSEDD